MSGSALLQADVKPGPADFEVRGVLSDEIGRPIAKGQVRADASSPGRATLVTCDAGGREEVGSLTVTTDAAGRFCVRIAGVAAGDVTLSYDDANAWYSPARRTLPLNAEGSSMFRLGFEPIPTTLSLDEPAQLLSVAAQARGGATVPAGSALVLTAEAGGSEHELSRAALRGLAEQHRFNVPSSEFPPPGPARLIARLLLVNGSTLAEASVPVLLRASVELSFIEGKPPVSVAPGERVSVRAGSAIGPVPGGVVEARAGGKSLAAARVHEGAAELEVPVTVDGDGERLTIHYIGDGPGWVAGAPLELVLRRRGQGLSRYAPWLLAAAVAALAVLQGFRRPVRKPSAPKAEVAKPRASVEVLEVFTSGGGYRGRLRDAHDGSSVTPAAVSILSRNGNATRVLIQVPALPDGTFNIEPLPIPSEAILEVTAPFHATLTAPLPPPGVIELSMISRRRALLDRLVRWAERHGAPWSGASREPTPSHVAAAAAGQKQDDVARWALAVERLAFGPHPPDAAGERAAGVTEEPEVPRAPRH